MKKKRFRVEQIVAVLKQAEIGVSVVEVIRKAGISEQTFRRWKLSVRDWLKGLPLGSPSSSKPAKKYGGAPKFSTSSCACLNASAFPLLRPRCPSK